MQKWPNVGRDYEEIERTALGTVNLAPESMSTRDVIGMCSDLSEAGIRHLIFNMPNVYEISPLETFGGRSSPLWQGCRRVCGSGFKIVATAPRHSSLYRIPDADFGEQPVFCEIWSIER